MKAGKTRTVPTLIALLVILLVILFSYSNYYQWFENKLLDLRFHWRQPIPISDQITHIDIDDKSIIDIGRWPWPRGIHAQLIALLTNFRAKAIVFDVTFPDAGEYYVDREIFDNKLIPLLASSTQAISETEISGLRQTIKNTILNYDELMSEAIQQTDNVYLPFEFPDDAPTQSITYPNSFLSGQIKFSSEKRLTTATAFTPRFPIPQLADYARGLGFVDVLSPDNDNMYRSAPLIMEYNDALYPQLAFRVAYEALGFTPEMIKVFPGEKIELRKNNDPPVIIPINTEGKVLVNWAHTGDKQWKRIFNHIPYGTLIKLYRIQCQNQNNPNGPSPEIEEIIQEAHAKIKDKICIVGEVSAGSTDLKSAPNDPLLPGVMFHSNIINMLLTNNFIKTTPKWLNLLIIFICGLTVSLLTGTRHPVFSVITILCLLALLLTLSLWLFSTYGIWLETAGPALTIILGFVSVTAYRTVTEEKAKRQVRETFGRYVAPQVVNELLKHPDNLKLGGEKKVLTVFFSDMANFTKSSTGLTPERMVAWINHYLSAMTPIIQQYNGMVDKFGGDAIMALFGVPIARADHAKSACWTALDHINALSKLNHDLQTKGLPPIGIRVGLNTGEMVVGNVGSEQAMNYTVFGEEVILASRLEGINKVYGTQILITGNTYEQAKDDIVARELDIIRAKGMSTPVRIYELLAKKGGLAPNLQPVIDTYAQALQAYRTREWDQALNLLKNCLQLKADDGPSLHLEQRCHHFKQNPPPEHWDAIYTLTIK
jgi:adenylate cyclase